MALALQVRTLQIAPLNRFIWTQTFMIRTISFLMLAVGASLCSAQPSQQNLLPPHELFERINTTNQANRASAIPLTQLPRQRALSYRFNNVKVSTIERYLRFAGIRLPVAISGDLTGWVWAQNQGSYFSTADYAAELSVESPLLVIDSVVIGNASLRLAYKNGLWSVRNVAGLLLPNQTAPISDAIATFEASGQLPASGPADFIVTANPFVLDRLQALFGQQSLNIVGKGTVALRMSADRGKFGDIKNWRGAGAINVTDLTQDLIEPLKLEANVQLGNGRVTLSQTRAINPKNTALLFAGYLQLDNKGEFELELPNQTANLSDFLRLPILQQIKFERLNPASTLKGTLQPFTWQADIRSSAALASVGQYSIGSVGLTGSINPNSLGPLALKGTLAEGTINGTYELEKYLSDTPNSKIAAAITNVQAMQLIPGNPTAMQVNVTGNVDLAWAGLQPANPQSLSGSINGTITSSSLLDRAPIQLNASKSANNENVAFSASMQNDKSTLKANGDLQWQDWMTASYKSDVDFQQLVLLLNNIVKFELPAQIDQRVVAAGKGHIQGRYPDQPLESADLDLDYVLGSFDGIPFGLHNAKGSIDQQRVSVDHADLFLNDRLAKVSGMWQLQHMGTHRGQVMIKEWSINELVRLTGGPMPIHGLDGEVSASFQFEKDAANNKSPWNAAGMLVANDLKVGPNDVGALRAKVQSNSDRVRLELDGDLLGGSSTGVVRFINTTTDNDYPILGSLKLNAVQLDKMVSLWQSQNAAALFKGSATGQVEFGLDKDNNLKGNARLDLDQVKYQAQTLTDHMSLRGTFNNERMLIEQFDFPFGGGAISGNGRLLTEPVFGADANLDFRNVEMSHLVAFVNVNLASSYVGKISGRAMPQLSSTGVQMRGSALGRNLHILSIPVDQAKTTISGQLRSDNGQVRMQLKNIHGSTMQGRLAGNINLISRRDLGFDAKLTVDGGHLEQFTKWSDTGNYIGKGIFDAQLNLNSTGYRNINDIDGTLSVEFGPTDAKTVPLINPLTRALPGIGLPSTQFNQGSLDAIVSNGQLRVQRSLLYNPSLWISSSGTVGLANKTLDLDVTVFTGSYGNSPLIENAVRTLTFIPDPTIQTISIITQAVSNRTAYLNVGGTANSPVIRLQTGKTVGRYVVESFVRQFTRGAILPSTAAASAVP